MRYRPRSGGFTLIELMIVIAIIAVIAAIAIPSLLEARIRSNETGVIQTMRTLHAAQELFRERDHDGDGIHQYAGDLAQLAGLIDGQLAAGTRYGYGFEVVSATGHRFAIRATCLAVGRSGRNGYHVDETGVIRVCTDNFADATDPPIGG
jgi:prepilin-type N-terminal cleavage/methylation domain-containing protein